MNTTTRPALPFTKRPRHTTDPRRRPRRRRPCPVLAGVRLCARPRATGAARLTVGGAVVGLASARAVVFAASALARVRGRLAGGLVRGAGESSRAQAVAMLAARGLDRRAVDALVLTGRAVGVGGTVSARHGCWPTVLDRALTCSLARHERGEIERAVVLLAQTGGEA